MQLTRNLPVMTMEIKILIACLLISSTYSEDSSSTPKPTALSSSYLHRVHNNFYHDVIATPILSYAPAFHTYFARPHIAIHHAPIVTYSVPINHNVHIEQIPNHNEHIEQIQNNNEHIEQTPSVTINRRINTPCENATLSPSSSNNEDVLKNLINPRFEEKTNLTTNNQTSSNNNSSSLSSAISSALSSTSSSSFSFRNLASRFNSEIDHTESKPSTQDFSKTLSKSNTFISQPATFVQRNFHITPQPLVAPTIQYQHPFAYQQNYIQQSPIIYQQPNTYATPAFVKQTIAQPAYKQFYQTPIVKPQVYETPGTVITHATFTGFGTHYEW